MREQVKKKHRRLAALIGLVLLLSTAAGCALYKPWGRLGDALDSGDYERAGELYDRYFAGDEEDAAAAEDLLAAAILRLESAAFTGTKPLLEISEAVEALSAFDYSPDQALSRAALASLDELAGSQQLSQEASASAGEGDLRGALLDYQRAGDWPVFAAHAAGLYHEAVEAYVSSISGKLEALVDSGEPAQAMALVDDALAVFPDSTALQIWAFSLEDVTRARTGEELAVRINGLVEADSYEAAWDELDLAAPDTLLMPPVISARGRLARNELGSLYGQLDTLEAEAALEDALAMTESALERYRDEIGLQARLINYRMLVDSGGKILLPEETRSE